MTPLPPDIEALKIINEMRSALYNQPEDKRFPVNVSLDELEIIKQALFRLTSTPAVDVKLMEALRNLFDTHCRRRDDIGFEIVYGGWDYYAIGGEKYYTRAWETVFDTIEKGATNKKSLWKNLNTAPRDGTQFLVSNGECVVMASWSNELIDVFDVTDHRIFEHYPPTHWMPLPAAPAVEDV